MLLLKQEGIKYSFQENILPLLKFLIKAKVSNLISKPKVVI